MPPKKRSKKTTKEKVDEVLATRNTTTEEPETTEALEARKQIVEQVYPKGDLCNHRNMHYTASELTCVLPKNHGGDHLGYVDDKPTAWSNAAGTPIKKHE